MVQSKVATVLKIIGENRFDTVAANLFQDISRKKIKSIIDKGGAYLNKKRIMIAKTKVKIGDKIELFWEENKSSDGRPVPLKIQNKLNSESVVFENEIFLVIDKPAGIPSQSTLTSSQDTILHALESLDKNKYKASQLYLVHRLDKDTSGLMIIAKDKNTQKKFEALFKERKIIKKYGALALNSPKNMNGIIDFPIAKDQSRKNCYFAVMNKKGKMRDAKESFTEYKVLNIYGKKEISYIECIPKTGRTHQIRVHLAALGCPLLGDKTYSQNIYGHRFFQIALRHMLHAKQLEFELDGKKFDFQSSLPEDFVRIIKIVENT